MKGRFVVAAVTAIVAAAPFSAAVADDGALPANFSIQDTGKGILVEWAALTVGGGAIFGTHQYVKLNLGVFTVSQEHWYYTPFEAEFMPWYGTLSFGGRAGYQHFIGAGWAVRAGVKLGWNTWSESTGCYILDGVEVAPHVQFIRYFKHGSVGIGVEAPVYITVREMGGTNCADCGYYDDVYPGIQGYVRLSAF